MASELILKKMKTDHQSVVQYQLNEIPMNELLGKEISLKFLGEILCLNCGKKTKKSFNQGYCFVCAQKLAACDMCQLRPERCHFHLGTCREPEWGEKECFIPHSIYLAATSDIKIGITRSYQKVHRWMDQGALSALEVAVVNSRLEAGLLEIELAKKIPDKTAWRTLITGKDVPIDLKEIAKTLGYSDGEVLHFNYPVQKYLEKAKTWDLEKENPTGILHGIRGQYLLIGEQAINVRKYQGYKVEFNY